MSGEKRLWEYDHQYYCSESNFFVRRDSDYYNEPEESWAEFLEGWGKSDVDMNLVFRWDWHELDPDDYESDEEKPTGWSAENPDYLEIFFMLQRKGIFAPVVCWVNKSDEPSIREWLASRWETMAAIWEPIGNAVAATTEQETE